MKLSVSGRRQQQQHEVGLRQHIVRPLGRQHFGDAGQRLGAPLGADHPHADRGGDLRHLLTDGA
jgi:hypothetical protein